MANEPNPYNADPVVLPAILEGVTVGSPMAVGFELSAEDMGCFVAHCMRDSTGAIRFRRWLAVGACLFFVLSVAAAGIGWPAELSMAALGGAGMLFSIWLWARGDLSSTFAGRYADPADRKLLGKRQVSIDREGVRQVSELVETFLKWAAVWKIEQAGEYLFLHTGNNDGLVIPQRAFWDERHFEAFVATARQFHQRASQPGDGPATTDAGPLTGAVDSANGPDGSPTSIGFELELDDLAAWIRHFYRTSPGLIRGRRRMVVVACVAFTLSPAGYCVGMPHGFSVLWLGCAMALAIALLLLASRLMPRRSLSQRLAALYVEESRHQILTKWQVELHETSIGDRSAMCEITWNWAAVHKIEVSAEHAFLYVGTMRTLIIPRRAFRDERHFETFVATARQFHERALAGIAVN